jgi:hypothetical protein
LKINLVVKFFIKNDNFINKNVLQGVIKSDVETMNAIVPSIRMTIADVEKNHFDLRFGFLEAKFSFEKRVEDKFDGFLSKLLFLSLGFRGATCGSQFEPSAVAIRGLQSYCRQGSNGGHQQFKFRINFNNF